MGIAIQEASGENVEAIHRLAGEWGYAVTLKQVSLWLDALRDSPNHRIFVSVLDGAVAGWIVVERRIALESQFNSEITGLVVGTRFRRLGVGRLLVSAAEEWSRSLGLQQILVRSNIRREESHQFYPSLGYKHNKTSHVYKKPLDRS